MRNQADAALSHCSRAMRTGHALIDVDPQSR